jgi:hypothetical protein
MTGESDPTSTTPASSGGADREGREHEDIELSSKLELEHQSNQAERGRLEIEALEIKNERGRLEIQNLDIQIARQGYQFSQERRLSRPRNLLITGVSGLSSIAFLGAALDSIYDLLPYAAADIWLGAALTLAGLALGTIRKISPEGNLPDQPTSGS